MAPLSKAPSRSGYATTTARFIAEGTTQGGSNGLVGEFKADLVFEWRSNQRLGVVEVFEEAASGSGEELHLDRVPIVFG